MRKLIVTSLAVLFCTTTLLAQERVSRSKRAVTNKTAVEVKEDSINGPTLVPTTVESTINMVTSPEMRDNVRNIILTDRDSNTYSATTLGTQIWMTRDLKTTKYNDGTPIPLVPDNAAWSALKDPAYCWYSNNENSKNYYGALYNWYAVHTGKLCPSGWHVPSDDEWTELEMYLQNNGFNYDGTVDADLDRATNNKTAKSLASATYWTESVNKGSVGNKDYPAYGNKSNFTAMPGGFRKSDDGSFDGVTLSGFWWSATESNATKAWHRHINENDDTVTRTDYGKTGGYSVRCVRD
jgi:uncharacterized protein (TIGR02145 family)